MRRKIERRLARVLNRATRQIKAGTPVISFSFDDVPRSACTTGADLLAQYGATATWYVSGGFEQDDRTERFHTGRQLQDLHAAGHEIACHGYAHLDYQTLSPEEIAQDLDRNSAYFARLDLPAARNFAYPYGAVDPQVKAVCGARFTSCRGIHPGINRTRTDFNLLRAVPFYSQTLSMTRTKALIDDIARNGGWLILFSHGVQDGLSDFDCTTDHLEQTLAHAAALQIPMIPVDRAINSLCQGG